MPFLGGRKGEMLFTDGFTSLPGRASNRKGMKSRRRRAGNTPWQYPGVSGPTPPGSPMYWWDGSDATQLFTDDEATTNVASDTDPVRAITSKGSVALTLTTGAADTDVTYDAVWTNGLSGVAIENDTGTIEAAHGSDRALTGMIFAAVYATSDVELSSKPVGGTGDNAAALILLDDHWTSFSGAGKRHSTNQTNNTVYAFVADWETDGTYSSRVSHDATILTGTQAYSDHEAADEIGWGMNSAVDTIVTIGEHLVWEGSFADNGLTDEDIITYLQDKWGVTFVAAS